MIDFVSTRESTDIQTRRCAHLLSAVIAQAIKDASEPMTKEEKQRMANLHTDALMAIRWLFGKHSTFPWFAQAVGSNAGAMRKALLCEGRPFMPKSAFSAVDATRLQRRYRMWCGAPDDSDRLAAMDDEPVRTGGTG